MGTEISINLIYLDLNSSTCVYEASPPEGPLGKRIPWPHKLQNLIPPCIGGLQRHHHVKDSEKPTANQSVHLSLILPILS